MIVLLVFLGSGKIRTVIGTSLAHYEITSHPGSGGMVTCISPGTRSWVEVWRLSFFPKRSLVIAGEVNGGAIFYKAWIDRNLDGAI
jgi:hypothetical protein